jgi:hypothetical protein
VSILGETVENQRRELQAVVGVSAVQRIKAEMALGA